MLTDGKKGGLYHILSVIMVSAQQMTGVGIGLGLVLIVKLLKLQLFFPGDKGMNAILIPAFFYLIVHLYYKKQNKLKLCDSFCPFFIFLFLISSRQ